MKLVADGVSLVLVVHLVRVGEELQLILNGDLMALFFLPFKLLFYLVTIHVVVELALGSLSILQVEIADGIFKLLEVLERV